MYLWLKWLLDTVIVNTMAPLYSYALSGSYYLFIKHVARHVYLALMPASPTFVCLLLYLCVYFAKTQRSWRRRGWKHFHLINIKVNQDQIEWASFMYTGQATALCCVYQCAVVCKYTHMAAYFCTHAYMWAWASCVCAWLMRIYRTSERAPCQVGTEEAQCCRPSSFNVWIRHSLGSGEDEKAGMTKITIPLCWGSAVFLVYLPDAWARFFSRLRLDTSKTRHPFACF